jgi:phage-related protein
MIVKFPIARKPVEFIGGCRAALRRLPKPVRAVFGYAILVAQTGEKHEDAKPLKGFSGAGVLEVVEDYDRSTYRAVYTVKFTGVVYVLHAFQKKSKKGAATPKADMALIKERLQIAEEHYREHYRVKITG